MALKTKRWCDPREPDDGFRVLVTCYRPRGLPKAKETWDQWLRALGPSEELFAAFKGKGGPPITLAEYFRRYREEMAERGELLQGLRDRLRAGESVTLLCSRDCILPAACHRTELAKLVQAE